MKLILIGGGTLGSVSPLISIWQSLKNKDEILETLFIGTKTGPEKQFISNYKIPFKAIASGKFRRYFSLVNFFDLFKILFGTIQSFFILVKFKPDYIISAGGYVAVPLIWSAKLFKVKVILYQSDLKVGLANKLCQKRADFIFTAFAETVNQFPKEKTKEIGLVLREEIYQVKKKIEISPNKPQLLILGGGTGSRAINKLINDALEKLTDSFIVIHITGQNYQATSTKKNYQSFNLLTDNYYQTLINADLIICRAGLSTIMELSYLAKPIILIPLPNSPQVENANYLREKNAAIVLDQNHLTSKNLLEEITKLNQMKKDALAKNIQQIFKHQGTEQIIQKIYELK